MFCHNSFSQNSFYAVDSVREIRISFYNTNWDYLLDSFYVIGDNDRIDLSHKAFSRSIFVKGAIEAAIFLSQRKIGFYSMEDVIKV